MDNDLSGQGKSYTCSFCEKAFSNAQALGGHMNIHRKDRAKLIESSEENVLSSGIVKTTNPPDHDQSQVSEVIIESSEEKSSSSLNRSPGKLSREDDPIEELKQLPLFVKRSSPTTSDDFETSRENKIELDLELRLGPEPHQETSSSKNTRDFF